MAQFRVADFASSSSNSENVQLEGEEEDHRRVKSPARSEYWEWESKEDSEEKSGISGVPQNLEVSVGHRRIKG